MIASLVLALLAVVNNPNNSVTYACDGSTATFSVNFPYLSSGDLVVTSTTAAGAVTTLTPGTDWSVNLSRSSSVGTLVLNSPATKCPAGSTLKIDRQTPFTQPQPFKGQTTFNPSIHEDAYDRTVMEIQRLATNPAFADPPLLGSGSSASHLTCRTATASLSGCLSSTDWTSFNSRIASVTADAPLTGTGTSGSHLGCPTAGLAQAGCLSSTDWNTFNNKSSNGVSLTTVNTWTATQVHAPGGSTPSGNAITATGGTSSGTGVAATGGTPNGTAVTGTGTGTAPGGTFTAGGGGTPADGAVILTPQATPSAPTNGAVWTTTAGLFARINGATQAYLSSTSNPMLFVNNSGQSIPNTTVTTIINPTVIRDTDSAYNATTGQYTVPVGKGGDYLVSAVITWSAAPGTTPFIGIYKNSVQTLRTLSGANAPGAAGMFISGVVNCAAGDLIDIRVQQTSGGAVLLGGGAAGSWLTIKRLQD